MPAPKLIPVSYRDSGNVIHLTCYADTLVYTKSDSNTGWLIGIRIGGYPEQVRGMSDAIYGGGEIRVERQNLSPLGLRSLAKHYTRQQSMDGVYAEAVVFATDDSDIPVRVNDPEKEGQTKLETPPRACYIFTPPGDRDRLFEEIDKRVRVTLLPEFQEYLLDELIAGEMLKQLTAVCLNEKFDAWMLRCEADDKNVIRIVEHGLREGKIQIPGSAPDSSAVFDEINTVSQYLQKFGVTIAERIKSQFVPLFDPSAEPVSGEVLSVNDNIFAHTGYHLYDAQLAAAEGLKRKLDRHDPALLIAECGSGKTKIGATALYASHLAAGKAKTFNIVLCPAHVAQKWCREIEETIPNSMGGVIKGISQLKAFYAAYEQSGRTAFAVFSKEKARDGYMHHPAVTWSRRKKGFLCPECHRRVMMTVTDDGINYEIPADDVYFRRQHSKNHKCAYCGSTLWAPLNPGVQSEWVKIGAYGFIHRRFAYHHLRDPKAMRYTEEIEAVANEPEGFFAAVGAVRRFALSTYVKKKLRGRIDGAIIDEIHQYARDSGQGDAMGELARTADKVVGMTATLINGYASGIFHLLYRLFPRSMLLDNKPYDSPDTFIKEYGVIESTYEITAAEYNANRRASRRKVREHQLPGVSPLVYSRFLLENAVFLSLMDMGKDLPEYEEIPIPLHLPHKIREEYDRISRTLKDFMQKDRKAAQKILSAYMGLLTVYPDQPYGHDPLVNPITGDEVVRPKDLATIGDLHPKDKKALEITRNKVSAGGRVLIYTSWVRIDSQQKLLTALAGEGIRAKILPASVKPETREAWVDAEVANGLQVLICNPAVVETGLDLNAFTTLIYYNVGYNLFTMRQASRRSWRINQTAPRIEVYFLYYEGVMQARAIELMASKLAVAGLVEGNFSDEGLAALSDCRDLTSQLAMELTTGIKESVEDIGAIFKRMAILHPTRPENVPQSTDTASPSPPVFNAAQTLTEITPPAFREESPEEFVFTAVFTRRRKKQPELEPDENQLSLFDLPKSA